MRTPHWLVVAALAFVCGLGIGVWWPDEQPAPSQQTGELKQVTPPEQAGPLAATGPSPQSPPEQPAPPKRPPPDLPELEAAEGRIAVRFVDPAGAPVEGVETRLRLSFPNVVKGVARADYATEDEYIIACVEHYHRELLRERALSQSALSDADGWVRFHNLPGEHATLTATAQGFRFERNRQSLNRKVTMGEELTIVVTRLVSVEVLVTSSGLEPGGQCRVVWASRDMSDTVDAKLGKATEVMVPEGAVEFRAESGSVTATQIVEITKGAARIEIHLGSHGAATGIVRFLGARPMVFDVRLARPITGVSDSDLLQLSRDFRPDSIKVDPSTGRFALEDGYDGEFVIGVCAGVEVLSIQRVMLGAAAQEIVLEVAAPDTSNAVIVNIVAPDGVAIGNERFWISSASGGSRVAFTPWVETPTRHLLVFRDGPDKLPATAIVGVRYQALGLLQVKFSPRVDREVTMKFEPACVVWLTIDTFPKDMPVMNLRTAPGPDFDMWDMWPLRRPGPHPDDRPLGRFQPGEYRFRLTSDHPAPWVYVEVTVDLKAGEETLVLEMPELHAVLLDGSGCAPYSHAKLTQVEAGVVGSFTFNDRHQAMFGSLPAGTYEVTYRAGGIHGEERKTTFTLPGTDMVKLE